MVWGKILLLHFFLPFEKYENIKKTISNWKASTSASTIRVTNNKIEQVKKKNSNLFYYKFTMGNGCLTAISIKNTGIELILFDKGWNKLINTKNFLRVASFYLDCFAHYLSWILQRNVHLWAFFLSFEYMR